MNFRRKGPAETTNADFVSEAKCGKIGAWEFISPIVKSFELHAVWQCIRQWNFKSFKALTYFYFAILKNFAFENIAVMGDLETSIT